MYRSLILVLLCLLFPLPAFAFANNYEAMLVLGQSTFTSNTAGTTSTRFNAPRGITVCAGKLILAELSNNRVLIWNSIPTTNNQPADVVIGQPDFTTNTANNGGVSARSLRGPFGVSCIGEKLAVADMENNRILIYNSVPATNFKDADVVIGQPTMSVAVGNNGGINANTLLRPHGVATDGHKLFVLDSDNRRALIFNSVPTSNNASANLVLGQSNFTSNAISCSASGFDFEAIGIHSDGSRLVIAQSFLTSLGAAGRRVQIWNSIPTVNNHPADVILGQSQPTDCSTVYPVSASSIERPFGVYIDPKGRLFVGERGTGRILVFNKVPSQNNFPADIVIGQPSFTTSSINQGLSIPNARTINGATFMTSTNDRLIVSDTANHRVLFYDISEKKAGITVDSNTPSEDNDNISMSGVTTTSGSYFIKMVEFSVNGGSWRSATAKDGSFNSQTEKFTIQFKKNNENFSKFGYTIRLRSINSNLDITDEIIVLSYFDLLSPADNEYMKNDLPTFTFAVANERFEEVKNDISSYKIEIKKANGSWATYLDDIPVFPSMPNIDGKIFFENDTKKVMYTDHGATIEVTPKSVNESYFSENGKRLDKGVYKIRIAAISKGGYNQYTQEKVIRMNTVGVINSSLPISLISPFFLSTTYPQGWVLTQSIFSKTPVFYGIANVGSTIRLSIRPDHCSDESCTHKLETSANAESRFGINIPRLLLKSNTRYTMTLSAQNGENYSELPEILIQIK